MCFAAPQNPEFPSVVPPSQWIWLRQASPGQLGGGLLSGLEALLVGLQLQDVLLLQLPLGRTVTQLDGQGVLA